MKQVSLSVAAIALLSSCASIIEGSSETIAVNTNPPAANCAFQREQDKQVIEIARLQTPGESTVKKTRKDITVLCKKPGFQDASFVNKSDLEPWFFGNILIGGLIGMGVDWGTGAYNAYEEQINIGMIPLPGTAMAPEQPVAVPATANALQGLAAPMSAYESGQEQAVVPQLVPAPAAPAQTLSLPATTAAAPAHILSAPAYAAAPVAIMPQAAPAYVPQQARDEERPVPEPLAPIVIPSGRAAANDSGWGRGQ